jgi:diaminopimelate epimerase
MIVEFTKMHGLGNDFMVVDMISQHAFFRPEQVRRLADRRMGVGFDQMLLVEPPSKPDMDFKYRIFNADGSEVEQCGNGARCFAVFVREQGLTDKSVVRVETSNADIELFIQDDGRVRVDMGEPVLEPDAVPFVADEQCASYQLELENEVFELSAVSMGNPHGVMLVDDVATADVDRLGPALESHTRFPNKANIGFMEIVHARFIKLRVYERGSGETLACGTGACAAVVAGIERGLLQSPVEVKLPGGNLNIEWQGRGHNLIMVGPAVTVYKGQVRI